MRIGREHDLDLISGPVVHEPGRGIIGHHRLQLQLSEGCVERQSVRIHQIGVLPSPDIGRIPFL